MVDSREKGARAEAAIKKVMRDSTGLGWERIPSSGALNEKHGLKGDLYVPNEKNLFCVEVKHYAEDHFTSAILTSKNPQLITWWGQAVRQGIQVKKKPLLLFKHDRSKVFAAYEDQPTQIYTNVLVNHVDGSLFYVSLLSDWLSHENPKFIL